MKRDLLKELLEWKKHPLRKPLVLRGARQVGKSWLVNELGKTFKSAVTINFEKEKGVRELFTGDISIPKLLERLALYNGVNIVPGETLLFLDEIQECEEAISYLRYFKEEKPELHVIAAGSLIDFVIEKIGLPVGRVQFLYLYPLSFGEFLDAIEREDLRNHILNGEADRVLHGKLLDFLKSYMWLGGMPAVLQAWIERKDVKLCQEIQDEIIGAYRQDFEKYAKHRQIEHVCRVFESIPAQLGRKFKFSNVDRNLRSLHVHQALELLEKAGIALPSYHSSGQGIPLAATRDDKKFKIFFFDVGLAQRILGLDTKKWVIEPIKVINIGAIAEQFVAQEFVAYSPVKSPPELFYWHREARASNAEVDLLWVKDGVVIPIEVKSGTRGGLKSMQLFFDSHPSSVWGVKISEMGQAVNGRVKEIPLYSIERLIKK